MTSAIRKAALCLHSLNNEDKDWLLSRLPEPSQNRIKYLLSELKEIGVPKNQDWLKDLGLSSYNQSTVNNGACDRADNISLKLNTANAKYIYTALEHEHDEVIAIILSYSNWHWKSKVLKRFKKSRRMNIFALQKDVVAHTTSYLQEAYVESFIGKLK